MSTPLVAIVGLPNGGKSTLFNKILGERQALTYPEAGTTRDRAYGLTTWNDRSFYVIDTAGIVARPDSELEKNVQKQTQIAQDEADLILLIIDGQTQVSSEDLKIAKILKQTKKPIMLAVNKIDVRNTKTETAAAAFQKLGLGEAFPVSSVNGVGLGDLLDAIVDKLNKLFPVEKEEKATGLRFAFVGKPNVGKSSLINALLQQERVLVHHEAGTTRSTVEIPFQVGDKKFILLDTAGIKKKWKQDADVAAAAAMQSIRVLDHSDVVFFTLDAAAEITSQDQIIARQILESRKSCVLVLNKSELLSDTDREKFLDSLPDFFPQMWFLPVVFVSAKTSKNLDVLLDLAQKSYGSASQLIEEEELKQFLDRQLEEHMPGKMDDQRSPKFFSFRQTGIRPPVFRLTVNFPAAIATSWKNWFEKQFRIKFGLEGTPIVISYIRKQ